MADVAIACSVDADAATVTILLTIDRFTIAALTMACSIDASHSIACVVQCSLYTILCVSDFASVAFCRFL